jgi:DNA-binding NarL/FixJ family response regulator
MKPLTTEKNSAARKRLLVIDDHPLMRTGIEVAVKALRPDIDTVGYFGIDDVPIPQPWEPGFLIAILDLNLAKSSGIDTLLQFRERFPALPVVVFSSEANRALILEAIDAGAMGFVPKTAAGQNLVVALRRVLQGEIYLPAAALGLPDSPLSNEEASGCARDVGDTLTPRQSDVFNLLLKGLPNKLIARELNVSDNTVKVHVSAVLKAIGAESRVQAVLKASQMHVRVPI